MFGARTTRTFTGPSFQLVDCTVHTIIMWISNAESGGIRCVMVIGETHSFEQILSGCHIARYLGELLYATNCDILEWFHVV